MPASPVSVPGCPNATPGTAHARSSSGSEGAMTWAETRRGSHARGCLRYPLERLRDEQLSLSGTHRTYVADSHGQPFIYPRAGVIGPSGPDGNEQHEGADQLGPCALSGHRVTKRVYPLNNVVVAHSSTHLTGLGPGGQRFYWSAICSGPEPERMSGAPVAEANSSISAADRPSIIAASWKVCPSAASAARAARVASAAAMTACRWACRACRASATCAGASV